MVFAGLQNGPDASNINIGLNEKQIPPAGANIMRIKMPEVTAALDAALAETDDAARDARYQEVCKATNANLPWATMWVANRYGVASSNLTDFVWTPAPGRRPLRSRTPRSGRSPVKRHRNRRIPKGTGTARAPPCTP